MSALLRFNGTPTVQQLTPTLPAESEAVATIRPLLHPSAVATGEFRHDSRRVVTSCWVGTALVWDVASGQSLCEPWESPRSVGCAALSRDGERLIIGYYDRSTIYEVPVFSGPVPFQPLTARRAVVAWNDSEAGVPLRLFKRTWENPRPDVIIDRIDFVSRKTEAAPFLVALTAE